MAQRGSKLTGSLADALRAVADAIGALPANGMIIGGIAAIVRGVPRATRDIDFTISGGHCTLAETLDVLRRFSIVPRIANAAEFAEANHVLLLRHAPSGIEVDASLAWLSFEEEALAASEMIDVADAAIPVARPEDLIIYKAIAWRPQDQQDIERLIELHRAVIDQRRVIAVVTELAEALDEPERVPQLQRLFERA